MKQNTRPTLGKLTNSIRTVLDIIHTHPSHQGRGAGAQLVKWGTDLADKERCQCYLESSPAGYPLFQKCDFEDVTEMEIELNQYKKNGYGQYRYKHIVMIRPPNVVVVPPKVPPKDSEHHHYPIGYWDFGLPTAAAAAAESSGSNDDDDDDDDESNTSSRSGYEAASSSGGTWVSEKKGRYGVVGGGAATTVGGGTNGEDEAFRPTSQYGVLDSVSEDGVVVIGRSTTSRFVVSGNGRQEEGDDPSKHVSLI